MYNLSKKLSLLLLMLPSAALAEDGLSGPNTAWILTSTALVLFMTLPGLALFYGGLVRTKNVLSVLMQCFAIGGISTILWLLVGYSLAFGEGNAYLREVAEHASVPVISMQCDVYHPCQILADLLTISEHLGPPRGLKLGVAWTSAPNYVRPLSVPQSLILLMPRFGIDVTLAYPPEFKLMLEVEEQARENARRSGASLEITHRFEDAFEDADVRSRLPRFGEGNLDRNLLIADAVARVARARNATPAQVALAWVMARWEHTVPIPGSRRAERIEETGCSSTPTWTGGRPTTARPMSMAKSRNCTNSPSPGCDSAKASSRESKR